jgi:hypothetical protein
MVRTIQHPERVKANNFRANATATDERAQEYREYAGHLAGGKLRDAYVGAADALETLAAALRGTAAEFDESAQQGGE